MNVRLFQCICELLLQKHYGLELDDTMLYEPQIAKECIETGHRPYELISEHAREADLDRIDKAGMNGVPSKERLTLWDEASVSAQLAESLSAWQPIATAPKDRYILGYDPGLKHPLIMIWNVAEGCYAAVFGLGDEAPTHWMPIPAVPKTASRHP